MTAIDQLIPLILSVIMLPLSFLGVLGVLAVE
jgi:hypothetical protein